MASSYTLHIVIIGLWLAYLATAWNIVGGFAGQHSLGHAMFVGAGAYVSSLLFTHFGMTPWIGAFAGAAVAAALAVAMGFLSFRYGIKGPYFFLVTIAFAEVAKIVMSNVQAVGASSGLYVPMKGHAPELFQFETKWPYLAIMAVMLAAALAISHAVRSSWFGLSLLALRENEGAARACGVSAERLKIAALALSAVLCAFAGTFYAQYSLFIEPQSMFGIGLSLEIVLFAIVGGIGTVYGPAAGAIVLYAIAEATRNMVALSSAANFANLHLIVYSVILILVVIFFPEGVAGAYRRMRGTGQRTPHAVAPAAATAGEGAAVTGIPARQANAAPLLRVTGVAKRFGGLAALSDVNVELAEGECLGLIGPNGSGKSTLINVVAGVYKPEQGEVRLRDRRISGCHPEAICRLGVGRTHQIAQPFGDLTTRENVMVGAYAASHERAAAVAAAESLLARLGIGHLADTRVRFLTTANRKKVELARALATGAKLVLLDEALAGLTEQETEEMIAILRTLKSEGLSLIVVEHIMRVVTALCDRVVFLNFGEIVAQGRPADVLRQQQVIDIYLGSEAGALAAVG